MSEMFSSKTAEEKLSRPDAPFKVLSGRSGGHITFPNGWTVSIQWSGGNYCANHHFEIGKYPAPDSPTAEVAIWRGDKGDLERWDDGDSVQGWRDWDQVQHLLDLCERDEILVDAGVLVASAGWKEGER